MVPRRVASLLRPPRQAGWPWYVLPAALAASSLVWTVEAVVDFFELLASASLPG